MELLDRYDVSPAMAWLAAFAASIATVVVGAIVFTRQVYWGFIWRYFLGPVRADAEGEACVGYVVGEGEVQNSNQLGGCDPALLELDLGTVYVAEPGYTTVSTLGYIVILVFMLAGVYLLLQQFSLDPISHFFYALVPFMLFGGALRTVEDAFVAAIRADQAPAIEYPLSGLLISPFIYFTVFGIALAAFLIAKYLARRSITETYYYPLATAGGVVLAMTVGYIFYLSIVTDYVTLYPSILLLVLGLATVLSLAAYYVVDKKWPSVNRGTGLMGLIVIWGHAIDGVANVLAQDWMWVWGLNNYVPKHVVNQLIVDTTGAIQGGTDIFGVFVGQAWPFLIVKIVVPVAILAVFDEEFFEDSPYYAVMLLGAIVAVGLGPGTRDMLRAAFGI